MNASCSPGDITPGLYYDAIVMGKSGCGLAIVDFRFATSCWEGYHFWIPVVEYVWYIQYTVFPL
ncbi:hypothetical protein KH990_09730 [Methanoculleus bourgensis]|uniref:hypothetical protein n=1 Tax=Methanoculleus bourgensis TaxID=83986 RepID=UPI001BDB410B|nr:hypothetical protein [Methanoculleus bourgensis]MBT0733640.1 hypothetical protein [Methanoculleus bourgensis]